MENNTPAAPPSASREVAARGRQQAMGMALVGGLLGVAVVGALQLLSLPSLTTNLTISAFAFAIATPALGVRFWAYAIDDHNEIRSGWLDWLEIAGMFAAVVGVAAIFGGISVAVGVTFLGTIALALVMAARGLGSGR